MRLFAGASLCAFVCVLLSGCAMTPTAIDTAQGAAIHGVSMGGRAPISGQKIYLLEAVTTGFYASGTTHYASKSLLTSATGNSADSIGYYVLSNASGGWTISGDYTCDAGAQVYVYGLGGNSGAGGTNTGIGLMAVLGQCPSSSPFNFATADPFVVMNEVTTVAAAYAMAGYATDATHVSSNSTTLAKQGIANAFANAGSLAKVSTGVANSYVPGNQATSTVPQQEINTLANILAACVNSNSPTSSGCSYLFKNATSDGASTASLGNSDNPTDTATAAINIAHHPSSNVGTLYSNLGGNTGAPYVGLGSQPNDFTVALQFTGGGLNATEEQPHGASIDATGNVWIASSNSDKLVEFSPQGAPLLSGTGYSLPANSFPLSVAVDANSANVWIAEYGGTGAVVKFNIAAGVVQGSSYTLSDAYDVELDGSGNPWAVGLYPSKLVKLSSSAALIGSSTGNGLNGPAALAFEPGAAGNVWVGNSNGNSASVFTNNNNLTLTGPTGSPDSYGSVYANLGIAIDGSGNAWTSNQGANSVSKLASNLQSGSSYALGSNNTLDAVAIDGANNVWVTDTSGTVWEMNSLGTNISGPNGFVPTTHGGPDALAIDGAGNVWYTDQQDATLYELVGAATPVVTPLAANLTSPYGTSAVNIP